MLSKNHEFVPNKYQINPMGMYVAFVVDEVDDKYEEALKKA